MISKASTICLDAKNPTQKHKVAMTQLFPSLSTLKRPHLSESFDPTWQCVAFQQQKKRKAAQAKPSQVTVMLVPKGKQQSSFVLY